MLFEERFEQICQEAIKLRATKRYQGDILNNKA